ncbi:tRNA (adenosine(37)-N6)-dimethylallyltransferase MiaA [bacterium]|nr:tRNA (adenosine(37)-N6)-dimethylallyltransferase MiaA [bacterium]
MFKTKVIAVVGATASGKTAYAVSLAQEIGGEIISADSRLVYEGFDIGTAKPTLEERHGIKHYLIDIVEPEVDYSAGLWVKDAQNAIDEIVSKGKTPIIAGGTGLYFRLLLENYKMPDVKPDKNFRSELEKMTFEELKQRLEKSDKAAADTIFDNDKKKLIRYIEIVEKSGLTLEEARNKSAQCPYEVEWIGLNFPREELYDRINKRVDLMIEQGLIDETKNLLKKHGRIPNLVDTIGYREIIKYLDGEYDLQMACEILKQNSRRYAKRQLTWFRANENIKWNVYPDKI